MNGDMYELAGVGTTYTKDDQPGIRQQAVTINAQHPYTRTYNSGQQVTYVMGETENGAHARVKYPSRDQIEKWPELAAWKGDYLRACRESIALLWVKKSQEVTV